MNRTSFFPLLLALATSISTWCSGQYGYVPLPVGAGPVMGGGTLASMAPSVVPGIGHSRAGTFLQIEGASLTIGSTVEEVQQVVSTLDAETTYGFMATFGHIGRTGLGMELSAGYYTLEFDESLAGLYGKVDADVSAKLLLVPVFVNARFSLPLGDRVALEVGAGAGGVYANATASAETSLGDYSASESAFTFGYQAMAGLSFALAPHADLTLHYRYMVLSSVEDLTAQSVGLGLRLRL
jgi:opacity protein-like surface antigen